MSSERIITTTSPLIAARGINIGNLSIRVRDTQSGRFVSWEVAQSEDFGLNGTMPVTYNHVEKTVTIRSPMSIDGYLSIKDRHHHNPRLLLVDEKRIILDSTYDEDNWELWNRWAFSHQKYVFELYL